MESYGYLLAELLKRNTELHGKALEKKGRKVKWPGEARKIILGELRKYKVDGRSKAFSGLLWGRIRRHDITTRQIYQLLLQWALHLTEKGLLFTYTADYEGLLEELCTTIESGAEGIVEDISPEEIIAEWESMKDYLTALHNECEEWVNENTQQEAFSICAQ